MTKIDPGDNDQQDRILVMDDEKKRALDLYTARLIPPDVGIFDEPTRCYQINKEWAKIVMGLVSWLTEIAPWRDATDESYPAIDEISKFLVGDNCMEFELRQSPTDDCLLEQTTDGGTTWTTAFDFSLCLTAQLAPINSTITTLYQQQLINNGFVPETSTPSDYYTPEYLQDLGVQADTCDTAGKDKIYGAVDQLVRYIHTVNVDFLQELSQAANVPQQVERFVAAVPGVGILPFDELIGYTAFLVDELLAEYNATADETLLQTVICDLFCIAVNSGCRFDSNDVYNYFAGKVSPTFSNSTTTLANLIQFAITGTFAGDDYFYFLCYFQLAVAGLKQKFMGIQGVETYALQMAAGFNSPDNDWFIFCISCPTQYRVWSWDFANGLGEWVIDAGTLESGRIRGTASTNPKLANVKMTFDPTWRVIGVRINNERIDGIANGSHDTRRFCLRPTANSNTGEIAAMTGGFLGNGVRVDCVDQAGASYWSGGNQVYAQFGVSEAIPATCEIYIDKIEILFDVAYAKPGAVITEDSDLCT